MAKDLKIVQDTIPAISLDEFDKQFDAAKDAIRIRVSDWGYKFHFSQLVKLAFKLSPRTLDKEKQESIKEELTKQHRYHVNRYYSDPDLQDKHPGGRYLFAYDNSCERLKQLVRRSQ